jgi:hypothetical protein
MKQIQNKMEKGLETMIKWLDEFTKEIALNMH